MPLTAHAYVPSKTLYAVDPIMAKTQQHGHRIVATFNALWTRTVKGVTSLAMGTLTVGVTVGEDPYETLLQQVDSRYGGTPVFKWDGTYLFGSQSVPFPEAVTAHAMLDELLITLPEVPAGYEGWFLLTA